MPTIAVVTSAPPFIEGGHLVIARSLVGALRDRGHDASLITTPSGRFGRQAAAYLANWCTDVGVDGAGRPIDQVITLRYPSYAVRHPRHVCWLNHTMREYYDQLPRFAATLSARGRLKERARRAAIRAVDTYCFKHHVTRLVAQSATVAARLQQWNGVTAEVLHPPPPPRPYRCDRYGETLFVVSRLTPLKRINLVVAALATDACRHVRCVIGGEGEERAALEAQARTLGIADRVTFAGRLTEDRLVAEYAGCRAVCFVPQEEDYGFVTVEAFASSKPVVTCRDSGAPAELVRDGVNGFVVDPTPPAVGAAIARLMGDAGLAERLGQAAQATAAALSWPATVDRLVL